MAFYFFVVGQEDQPFAIWRRVGEPVVVVVFGDLLWVGAVGLHSPDLHGAGAVGIEVDKFAVGGEVGAVVEAIGGGEAGFFAAVCRDGEDSEFSVALATEGEGGSVGGPAVPVGGEIFGDAVGCAAGDGDCVNDGLMRGLGLIANGDGLAVGGQAVIVIAAVGESGVDFSW